MASEDVIELGSSDDEVEPAPKKMKPMPNAMVHIPNKLPEVTIKTTKTIPGKSVTVNKIQNIVVNPFVNKIKMNGRPLHKVPLRQNATKLQKPIPIQANATINPLNVMKKLNNTQVMISKVPGPLVKVTKQPIKIQSPRALNNLPSSITVTKTSVGSKQINTVNLKRLPEPKHLKVVNVAAMRKQPQTIIKKQPFGEVLTVDLDDDNVPSPATGPQWYLRPEDQIEEPSMEEENNAEPETPKFIEITIEDSPVKPIQSKKACDIGTELAITIDDSPIKVVVEKDKTSDSDCENIAKKKQPNSKKKLMYPKSYQTIQTVEIEVEPMEIDLPLQTEGIQHTGDNREESVDQVSSPSVAVIDRDNTQESSISTQPNPIVRASEKIIGKVKENIQEISKGSQLSTVVKELVDDIQLAGDLSEFHPVYRSFIKICLEMENSEDMQKIVEKKIKTYYKQVPKEYTESEDFLDMVSSKIISIKAGPEKMYLYIKDVVDELNLQRKMAKTQTAEQEKIRKAEDNKFLYGENSEFDSKRQRQIRKLEKTLKKLHRAIQKLEEQEVDFDDEEDSVYLLTESEDGSCSSKDVDSTLEKNTKVLLKRYKERMVRVHAKFCQLTNTKMPSEPRIQIDVRPGQPSGPGKRLEKWINRKVPIGTPLPFPDFHDVLRCVKEANDEDRLGWNEADIMLEARDLFTRCGKKLQRRRQENEWRLAVSRITLDEDPAENSEDLKKKLEENKRTAAKKETEVLNKYADRQNQLKLEGEEIGDKEAEESPVESEEEEGNDESSSLENKEKRKERLKRLLQQKSKKVDEEKVNKPLGIIVSEDGTNKNTVDINESKDIVNVIKDIENESRDVVNKKDYDLNENKDCEIKTLEVDVSQSEENNKYSKKLEQNQMEIDTVPMGDSPETQDTTKTSNIEENIQSLSDDSWKVESDIDELHLLQKLHSGSEINTSTLESTDSDTPIAISDTLESSDMENNDKRSSDVISIENSSYSESEINKESLDTKHTETDDTDEKKVNVNANVEIEFSTFGVESNNKAKINEEQNEMIEDILLASSDEDTTINKETSPASDEICVNLKDDAISIGDTIVEKTSNKNNMDNTIEHKTLTSAPNETIISDASSIKSVSSIEHKEFYNAESIDCSVESNSVVLDSEEPKAVEASEESTSADFVETVEESKIIFDSDNTTDNVAPSKTGDVIYESDENILSLEKHTYLGTESNEADMMKSSVNEEIV